MATFSFVHETFREVTSYPVAISLFESEAEQRRLLTNKPRRRFEIMSPALTQTQMAAQRDFHQARKGALEDFSFVSPKDGVTYTVRYDGDPEFDYAQATWRIKTKFITVDTDEDA